MLEECYAAAEKVVLVMDNLNTHNAASLYTAFPPEEARSLVGERLEIHYTPKHGSWLNIAEIELSVLKRQCFAGRIADIDTMRDEVHAWNIDRNNRQSKVDWQFRTKDARIKLKQHFDEEKKAGRTILTKNATGRVAKGLGVGETTVKRIMAADKQGKGIVVEEKERGKLPYRLEQL